MTVTINGTPRELPAGATAADAVRLITDAATGLAVAVNDEVLRRAAWDTAVLADGDVIEILTAVQGG
jgi:sulfur carrier protein